MFTVTVQNKMLKINNTNNNPSGKFVFLDSFSFQIPAKKRRTLQLFIPAEFFTAVFGAECPYAPVVVGGWGGRVRWWEGGGVNDWDFLLSLLQRTVCQLSFFNVSSRRNSILNYNLRLSAIVLTCLPSFYIFSSYFLKDF